MPTWIFVATPLPLGFRTAVIASEVPAELRAERDR